jgi:phytoene desaturase
MTQKIKSTAITHKPTAIVIGGGLGGLAGAITLATRGFAVTLLEKNSTIGGKMNTHVMHTPRGIFSFGTGPSLLTMPYIIDKLFSIAGIDRRERLDFKPLEPICRYFFNDSSTLDASSHQDTMISRITDFAGAKEAKAYSEFLEYAETIYRTTADVFLHTPFQEFTKLLHPRYLSALTGLHNIDAWRTVDTAVRSFFHDERLVQLFNRYPTYNGSDPHKAPATLNIIPYVEYGLGGFSVGGGMYRIAEELHTLAIDCGVTIECNAQVEEILHEHQCIAGVRVGSTTLHAEYVLCNADVVEAHRTLIQGFPDRRKKLDALEPSVSGMVFLWCMKKEFAELHHHNIFFSDDYRREFQQIFDEHDIPNSPTVYVSIASKSDATLAPAGCENWFVLLNMPYLHNQDWDKAIHRMKSAILRTLLRHGIDAEPHIIRTLSKQQRQYLWDFV